MIKYKLILFIFTFGLILFGCDSEPERKQSELGIYSAGDLGLLGHETEQCTAMALDALEKSGRSYHFYHRKGIDSEEYTDAWVGSTLFHAPAGNVSGFGQAFTKDKYPGVALSLSFYWPNLKSIKRHNKPEPATDELPRKLEINISCILSKRLKKLTERRAHLTVDDVIYRYRDREKTSYPPAKTWKDIGLKEYALNPGRGYAYFFPIDDTIKNPNGGVFSLTCPSIIKGQNILPTGTCGFWYTYNQHISVEYRFPYQRLSEWQRIHEFVTELVRTMEQEI